MVGGFASTGAIEVVYGLDCARSVVVSDFGISVAERVCGADRGGSPKCAVGGAVEGCKRGVWCDEVARAYSGGAGSGSCVGDVSRGVDGLPDREEAIYIGVVEHEYGVEGGVFVLVGC